MPYTTITSGTTITASWANANVRDQVVTPFAGTSARSSAVTSPIEGMATYDTSNDRFEIYTTSTTGWVAPWNLPWGYLVSQTCSGTDQTGISAAAVDVTGLTALTFTAVANRRYRITFGGVAYAAATSGVIAVYATNASNAVLGGAYFSNVATATNLNMAVHMGSSPITGITAGSVTWKIRAQGLSATGVVIRNSESPMWAMVEDIGPNGAPA